MTHISTFISLIACMTLAVSAYVVFTDKTQGNILNNFPRVSSCHFSGSHLMTDLQLQDDTLINVARFSFGLNMFTTLPLELFVCREVSFWLLSFPSSIDTIVIRWLSSTSFHTKFLANNAISSLRRRYFTHLCLVSFELATSF